MVAPVSMVSVLPVPVTSMAPEALSSARLPLPSPIWPWPEIVLPWFSNVLAVRPLMVAPLSVTAPELVSSSVNEVPPTVR